MLDNIIIGVLILLLIIAIYYYYCLSQSMIDYESDKMLYINNKEQELSKRNIDIEKITRCKNENDDFQDAIDKIFELSRKGNSKNIMCKIIEENKEEEYKIDKLKYKIENEDKKKLTTLKNLSEEKNIVNSEINDTQIVFSENNQKNINDIKNIESTEDIEKTKKSLNSIDLTSSSNSVNSSYIEIKK